MTALPTALRGEKSMTKTVIESLDEWERAVHRLARSYGNVEQRLAVPDIVELFRHDYEVAPELMRSLFDERTSEYARHGVDKAAATARANARANRANAKARRSGQ
jgi:hypothetical protein